MNTVYIFLPLMAVVIFAAGLWFGIRQGRSSMLGQLGPALEKPSKRMKQPRRGGAKEFEYVIRHSCDCLTMIAITFQ